MNIQDISVIAGNANRFNFEQIPDFNIDFDVLCNSPTTQPLSSSNINAAANDASVLEQENHLHSAPGHSQQPLTQSKQQEAVSVSESFTEASNQVEQHGHSNTANCERAFELELHSHQQGLTTLQVKYERLKAKYWQMCSDSQQKLWNVQEEHNELKDKMINVQDLLWRKRDDMDKVKMANVELQRKVNSQSTQLSKLRKQIKEMKENALLKQLTSDSKFPLNNATTSTRKRIKCDKDTLRQELQQDRGWWMASAQRTGWVVNSLFGCAGCGVDITDMDHYEHFKTCQRTIESK